jgi:O-antigen/teichoic acid export membrane protein
MKLVKHSFYNILGLGLPIFVAIFSIPVLIHSLGDARFGMLTLIWAVVSYFGLFDLGLGRALTQELSVIYAKEDVKSEAAVVATSVVIMTFLGLMAALILGFCAQWLLSFIQEIPDKQEALNAMYAMAIAMPAIIMTSCFKAILEAKHEFEIINLIRLPLGIFNYIGPVMVALYINPRLDYVAIILAIGRILGCISYGWYAWSSLSKKHGQFIFDAKRIKQLCISGGWLTVSNVVSPFMGYIDRFMIGAIASAAFVAYYATPQELITKLWIIPGAVTTILFPAFAADIIKDKSKVSKLFNQSILWLFWILLPVTVFIACFANEILSVWVGHDFAKESKIYLQIFSAGILLNCLAHIPFTLIQSAGHSKITAYIHLIELPIFIFALWMFTSKYGVLGASLAWIIRISLDAILLFIACNLLMKWNFSKIFNISNLLYLIITFTIFIMILIFR